MPVKQFADYIIKDTNSVVTLSDYSTNPATAFLKYVVCAKDASVQCTKKFKTSARKNPYSKDALESIYIINAGLLAAIMGNFETFQKYMFALMFDYSIYLKSFNVERCLKKLKEATKVSQFDVDFVRFAAYRDNPVAVGIILADQLKNWQSPTIVNGYFHSFELKDANGKMHDFYDSKDRDDLAILWQMRHSIVHTASTITLPDSQKVCGLEKYGGEAIILDKQFIYEVARRFHYIIKKSVDRLSSSYLLNLKEALPEEVNNRIMKIFRVSSSCNVWLR